MMKHPYSYNSYSAVTNCFLNFRFALSLLISILPSQLFMYVLDYSTNIVNVCVFVPQNGMGEELDIYLLHIKGYFFVSIPCGWNRREKLVWNIYINKIIDVPSRKNYKIDCDQMFQVIFLTRLEDAIFKNSSP